MLRIMRLYYVLAALPYILLLVGATIFFEPIKKTILNNPIPHLNYAIIVIVLTSGPLVFSNVWRLVREARILREFSAAIHAKMDRTSLRELADRYTGDLACILQMVATTSDRSISHQEQAALQNELSNARSRLVRRNALPQYLTGLLVAMGLLGTFIGLLATLADISVLIGSFADIDMNNIDPIQIFQVMIQRMRAPMTSMGIAFSTSMFGLLGSIVLGLMMLGVRRLQGDIFSVLSSEVTRHIEMALSFESISFRGKDLPSVVTGENADLTAKVLLRIEERLAESARVRQRALNAEIDDFKRQRSEMLQVMTEQAEASKAFRSELQTLGGQIANVFEGLTKFNSIVSGQISDLMVNIAGDTKETQKLLRMQVEEQRTLRDTLDSYKLKEQLAESISMQQRAVNALAEDFNLQRAELKRTLVEQTEASTGFSNELQLLRVQLDTIFSSMKAGGDEISSQISELTVLAGADAKESQRLIGIAGNRVCTELQQTGSQIASQLREFAAAAEKGDNAICERISDLQTHLAADSREVQERVSISGEKMCQELQQTGGRLQEQIAGLTEAAGQGNADIDRRIVELMERDSAAAREMRELLENEGESLRGGLQQVGHLITNQFGSLSESVKNGGQQVTCQLSDFRGQAITSVQELHHSLNLLVAALAPAEESEVTSAQLEVLEEA